MTTTVKITPGQLTLADCRAIYAGAKIELDPAARPAVEASVKTVTDIIENNKTVYGINTGFGRLARTSIPTDKLKQLQANLVMSHATCTGQPIRPCVVRLIMALKVNALARGHSGIRWKVLENLVILYNNHVYPVIPEKGSVGASGDLGPLAHMSCALLGIGNVDCEGAVIPASQALEELGLEPVELGPKEGLALLNGTQASTALALAGLFLAENSFAAALVGGALSVDAAMASDAPFDPRIQFLRGHTGQIDVAEVYRKLLKDSNIRNSHLECDRVQDPYSLRCQPQVMGACLDHLRFAARIFAIETNAISDNPLVFTDNGDVISGGNFHGEPVAMSADVLAISLAEIGALSERRIALLMDPALSGLPAFLVEDGGVNSGFMIAQVTAAALASENKTLAHPASIDSLSTSANQEDHVSMSTFAARRLTDIAENVAGVVAVELLAAAQGIDFHKPVQTSLDLQKAMSMIRKKAAYYDQDRYFAPDIEAIKNLVLTGKFLKFISGNVLPSQQSMT